MSQVPQGWKDDGTTLVAPNGVPVIHGFRDWVLSHNWDAEDFPLAAERQMASVEYGNPTIGAGYRQDFRMTSLGYTTARNVYRIWTGQDLVALKAALTAAQNATPATAPDPVAAKALAALQTFKAALGEL